MFSKKIFIFTTIVLILASAHNLSFDLRSIKYAKAADFWTVDVPCSGGSGQYSYEYVLPSGWKNEGNKIKIPSSSTKETNNQYVVRCKVRDSSNGDVLERSLAFKPFSQGTSTSLQVTDHDYFFGNAGLNTYSQESSITGFDVLNRLNSLVRNNNVINLASVGPLTANQGSYSLGGGSYQGYSSGSYQNSGFGGSAGGYSGSVNGNINSNANLNGYSGNNYNANANANANAYNSYGSQSNYGTGSQSQSQLQSQSQSQLQSQSQSQSLSQSSYSQSQSNVGLGSQYTVSSQAYSSSSSLYSSLPQISKLESYISGGDVVEIIQTIQLVVDSKVKCDAKSSYLADFLGRICAAIEIKKFTLQQLKQVVTVAVSQVQKLTVQIQSIKTQEESLHIQQLNYQLNQLITQLKGAYDEYNNFTSNYSSYDVEIASLEKEINEINQNYTSVQQKFNSLKGSLQDIDQQISQYQSRLRQLKDKRVQVQNEANQAQTYISQKDARVKQIKTRIDQLKAKIATYSTQKQKLKQMYLVIQKEVTSLKQSLRINQQKFDDYEQQIVSINIEIQRYQKQTSEIQIKQVSQCIQNLQSAMTDIKQSIDFVAYHCFDASNIQIDYDKSQNSVSYHFGQNQWFTYVNKCYSDLGEQIRNKIINSFRNQVVEISTINVFSDVWKNSYGSCFEKDIQTKVSNKDSDKTYGFSSDFSCSGQFGSVESKSGVIQNISANQIGIRGDDGRDYNLRLGSCSKFEGQGKEFVPKKGQSVFWKGSKKDNSYNLHSCTCY